MCGESRLPSPRSALPVGSPPHVWGKLLSPLPDAGGTRITPTCVGKAAGKLLEKAKKEDHPHMCGESKKSHGKCQSVPGSPPHVWGKLPMTAVSARQSRITPTCVGKARTARINENREKDHPHMCGESSRQKPVTRSLSRITPTCVGKADSRNKSRNSH